MYGSQITAPAQKAAPAAGGLKVGDVKMIKGKQMTITKVYPDGTFDAK
jgi:hypothetical protein